MEKFRAVVLDGSGQCIGLASWGDNWDPADIAEYVNATGLPGNVKVTPVPIPGYSPGPVRGDMGTVEISGDIEMALSMAPGAEVVVYMGNEINSIFETMLTDSRHCNQFSASYLNWPSATSMATALNAAAAQGQTVFLPSGDWGADDLEIPLGLANVVVVGGTVLSTNSDGSYQSEAAWPFGGAGIRTNIPIPDYQQSIAGSNGASATNLNIPDVSMVAQDVTVVATYTGLRRSTCAPAGGSKQYLGINGTSLSSPLWAGFMALVNQYGQNHVGVPVGFASPTLYSLYGVGPAGFNDVTTDGSHSYTRDGAPVCGGALGNDDVDHGVKYPAGPGYDLATGLGSPNCGLITQLALAKSCGVGVPTCGSGAQLTCCPSGNCYGDACVPANFGISVGWWEYQDGPVFCIEGTGFTSGASVTVHYSNVPVWTGAYALFHATPDDTGAFKLNDEVWKGDLVWCSPEEAAQTVTIEVTDGNPATKGTGATLTKTLVARYWCSNYAVMGNYNYNCG
jgi:subtilase family serine protease